MHDTNTDQGKTSQKEDIVAILLHIKRIMNSHVDEYVKYIMSDETLNSEKQERFLMEDCNMIKDAIRYISNQRYISDQQDCPPLSSL